MVAAFQKASGKKISLKKCPSRAGDAVAVYPSTEKAEKELGWKSEYGVEEMCSDQWCWAQSKPSRADQTVYWVKKYGPLMAAQCFPHPLLPVAPACAYVDAI
ncbi:hypothetical protein K1719_042880 [Acacia pycnantha]|nr:hypothetical protein K1719_042880 [Acacia pycnantha]